MGKVSSAGGMGVTNELLTKETAGPKGMVGYSRKQSTKRQEQKKCTRWVICRRKERHTTTEKKTSKSGGGVASYPVRGGLKYHLTNRQAEPPVSRCCVCDGGGVVIPTIRIRYRKNLSSTFMLTTHERWKRKSKRG